MSVGTTCSALVQQIIVTILKDTGEVLMPQDLKKCQTYGGKRIFFENEEVNQIKRFDPSGMFVYHSFTIV